MDHPKDHSLFGLGLPGFPFGFRPICGYVYPLWTRVDSSTTIIHQPWWGTEAKEGNMIQRLNHVPNNHFTDWLQGCRCNVYNLLTQDLETKKVLLPWRLTWCMLKIKTTQVAMFFCVPDFHFLNFQVVMKFPLQRLASRLRVHQLFLKFPVAAFFQTFQGQTSPRQDALGQWKERWNTW